MSKINNEPLKMIDTFIKYFPKSGYYNFEVEDQYGRWWIYRGLQDSLAEIEEIGAEEVRKGIINLDLYWFDNDRIVSKIRRQEEVWYVYFLNIYGEYGTDYIDEHGANIMVTTKDGLEYMHDKVFHDYDKLKALALKIKEKGVINLEHWMCQGWDDDTEGGTSYLKVFEDKSEYYEEPREWSSQDIYNSLGGEDGEMKYMHDGAWISPDGTITYDR